MVVGHVGWLEPEHAHVRTGGGPDVGDVVGDAVGEDVGVAVGEPVTTPVQAMPLSVKLVGIGLLVVQVPLNPNDAVPPVPMVPL
jgi:hypothetical protein